MVDLSKFASNKKILSEVFQKEMLTFKFFILPNCLHVGNVGKFKDKN